MAFGKKEKAENKTYSHRCPRSSSGHETGPQHRDDQPIYKSLYTCPVSGFQRKQSLAMVNQPVTHPDSSLRVHSLEEKEGVMSL